MATVNEQIVTGRKFRKLVDEATKLWQRISFWTKAVDVEFNDNKTAEIKLGAIDGITDSLVSTSSRIAASAKAVNTLNNNLKGFTPIIDDTGKITGYKTQAGADTVFPFRNIENNSITLRGVNARHSVPLRALPQFVVVVCKVGTTNVAGIWYDGIFVSNSLIHSISNRELIIVSSWSETYTYSYYLVY